VVLCAFGSDILLIQNYSLISLVLDLSLIRKVLVLNASKTVNFHD